MSIKCAAVTSLCWIAIIAIGYGYVVTTQHLIIPNQTGYMEVRHNDLQATPSDFSVVNTHVQPSSDQLDNLIQEVSR